MIPYNTDAPLYHLPVATAGLIVINAVLFFAVPLSLLDPQNPAGNAVANDFWADEADERVDRPREDGWDDAAFAVPDADDAGAAKPIETEPAAEMQHEFGPGDRQPWRAPTLVLEYGVGLKPWQWVSSIFMHSNFLHLLFNMIFLWAFGLVVEGKVGGLVFLAIYMGIGVGQSAIEQTIMSFADSGGSLGASAAIFGILGVAVMWAPRNEFDVFWLVGFHAGSIEIPILVFGFLQFAVELIAVAYGEFGVSSGLLHLMGLAMGIAVGWIWLRRNWVDCEGWDLLNVWHGTQGGGEEDAAVDEEARSLVRASVKQRSVRTSASVAEPAPLRTNPTKTKSQKPAKKHVRKKPMTAGRDHAQHTAATAPVSEKSTAATRAVEDLQQLLNDGHTVTALKLISKLRVHQPTFELPQPLLYRLIRSLLAAEDFSGAVPYLAEHIRLFAVNRRALQLNLAKILLYLQRPRKAVEVLREMQGATDLDEKSRATWQQLAAHAKQQIAEGVVELSD